VFRKTDDPGGRMTSNRFGNSSGNELTSSRQNPSGRRRRDGVLVLRRVCIYIYKHLRKTGAVRGGPCTGWLIIPALNGLSREASVPPSVRCPPRLKFPSPCTRDPRKASPSVGRAAATRTLNKISRKRC